jgi:ABC-type sulfate/molybdate transport systems ATPase subunit
VTPRGGGWPGGTGDPLMPCARIGCRGLEVRAGDRSILSVPALAVAPGETLAVLGANGAGKSTLLRALALLRPRHAGEVLLDGRPATGPAMREAVAAVLQRPVLRRGTVAANAATGLLLRGVRRREALRRSQPWLDRLGVGALAPRDARSLSGGESQRVSIARALAVPPRVLLLDEPFAALDATTRSDLVADLRGILTDLDVTTILVTHDRDEAAALADRTLLLVAGEVRQEGRTSAVLGAPADADCARLVGFGNVLGPAVTGLPTTVVARPEHTLALASAADALPGALVVEGRLHRVVPLGGMTRIDVAAGGVTLACLAPGDAPRALVAGGVGVKMAVAVPHARLRTLPASSSPPSRTAQLAVT